jgi:hypothetical protein
LHLFLFLSFTTKKATIPKRVAALTMFSLAEKRTKRHIPSGVTGRRKVEDF